MGSSNETSAYGPVLSPWRRNDGGNAALTPGGSSGGSASGGRGAARARRRPAPTPAARSASPPPSPASPGIKPTYGRCSRWGIVAFASSLDQAGPMARDVRDCAILLEAMAGFDPKDSTSLELAGARTGRRASSADVRGKRIGIPKEYRIDGVPAEIDRGLGAGHRAGCATPAPRSSRSRCRTPNMRCRPITSSPRPRPRPTSPAMTACATACASSPRRAASTTCTRRPAPPASAPRSSAGS